MRQVKGNIERLETLLYIKKVHLRPDFIPWMVREMIKIPHRPVAREPRCYVFCKAVDLMSREDREAVFKEAVAKVCLDELC